MSSGGAPRRDGGIQHSVAAWTMRPAGQILWAVVAVAALFGVTSLFQNLVSAERLTEYHITVLRYVGINIIMAASLNLVNGVAGQFSIGHAGFMAIGGYASALVTMRFHALGASHPAEIAVFLGSLVLGGLLAALAGMIVGQPSLRLHGDYLAIVTLGFGEIIRVIILNVDALGGARALSPIQQEASLFWIWLVVIVTVVALYRIQHGDFGRALLAIREDEIAAEAMGIETTKKKVGAFAIAAFFAGIGGGLFAHTLGLLSPNIFTFDKSFSYVVIVILGGMGSLSGSVLAAIVLTVLLEALRPSTVASVLEGLGASQPARWVSTHDFRIALYALLLILMMILRPNGFFGSHEIWQTGPVVRFRAMLSRRRKEAAA